MKGEIMELIPQEIRKRIPKLYDTEDIADPVVHVKLFMPDSNYTWYITEMSIDEDICFGYVVSTYGSELGYFSLNEIREVRGTLGLGVERDITFKPVPLSSIKKAS